MIDAFEPEFMQRALLAGLLAVMATSVIGTWVVLRGLAFLGDALAHGVIPGIALAVLWGFNPIIGALAAALSTRLLESLLFEVSRSSPWVYVVAAVALLSAAAVAAAFPAVRASRLSPSSVLQAE